MANRIQIRRDTSVNWTTVNPILADGEPGLEIDTNQVKYGDGNSTWITLSYAATNQLTNNVHTFSLNAAGVLQSSSGNVSILATTGNILLTTGSNSWTFGQTNTITWPDNSQQTTAWPGLVSVTPLHPNSDGIPGQITHDGTYLYVCVATNTWVRSAIDNSWI